MSLLKKASIITTPTAYAEDYLYSIKPAQSFSSELVTNGGFESSASWTVSGTDSTHIATFSNGTLRYQSDTTSPQLIVAQASVLQTGRLYKITVNVTTLTSGYVKVDSLGGLNITPSAGTNIFYKTATGTTFNITRGTTNVDVTIDSISVLEVTDADFDFDRNSTGTRVNEDYLIEDVPYNLLTYSEDFNSWAQIQNVTLTENATLSPIGTGNATKVLATSTSAKVRNNFTCQNGVTYTFSIFCKNIDATTMTLLIYDGSASYLVDKISEVSTDAWSRISISFTATQNSTSGQIQFARDLPNGESAFFWGAQLVKGDQPKEYLQTTDRLDIPRIDYTNGEPSILLELSRTNSNTYSSDFTQTYWSKQNGATVSSNQTTSPEGIVNADKLISTNATSEQYLLNASISTTSGNDVTISCFVKKLDYDYFHIRFTATDGVWVAASVWYNIDNGTLGTVESGVTAEIIEYPNGWYRCIATRTATGTGSGRVRLQLASSDNTPNVVGDGTKGTFIYGAQWEAGSYPTSLIHTSGSAVTRSADYVNNAGNSDLFNDSEGVLYAEIKALADDQTFRCISINADSTRNDQVMIRYRTNSNLINFFVRDGGSVTFNNNVTVQDITEYHKVALKYKDGDIACWVDGEEKIISTATGMPSGLSRIGFQLADTNLDPFVGKTKAIAVFKEALSDEELACLTGYNNHELYMNYYNRLSYLGLVEEYNVESDINNYIL